MKSSSEPGPAAAPGTEHPVLVATGLRMRGASGRLTARLVPHGVDQLEGRPWVLVGRSGGPLGRLEVEAHEVYGERLVVKFRGLDAAAAQDLVGQDIFLPCKGLVDLPEGSYYIFELVGMKVATRAGRVIGTVRSVVHTGGTPLLAVQPAPELPHPGEEILLPAARSICTAIDRHAGLIVIEPPEGLLELYGI